MDNDANKLLNDLFNKAKNEPSKVSFEETKERFLTSVSTKNNATQGNNFARLFNLKNSIIMIASIITTVALVLVLKPSSTTNTTKEALIPDAPTIEVINKNNEQQATKEHNQVITEYLQKVNKLTPQRIAQEPQKKEIILVPADSLKKYQEALVQSARITELLDTGYKFPKLTYEKIGRYKLFTCKPQKLPTWNTEPFYSIC